MPSFVHRYLPAAALVLASLGSTATTAQAVPISIVNSGFEDTTGQSTFNEFTFGTPIGWDLHDPNNLIADSSVFTGTLLPNGTDFFNTTAPEGNRVALLFNSGRRGEGEYGYVQTLGDTLQANTSYSLSVEVGNIASGTATNNQFFDLSGFPGYRVELLAGGVVIADDIDSLTIAEGEFDTANLFFDTGNAHAQLGQALGIRLVNLNQIPVGLSPIPDLEVDFDDVRLDATARAVSEPGTLALFTLGLAGLVLHRRRRQA